MLAKELGKAPCLAKYKNSMLITNEFIKQNTTKETLKLVPESNYPNIICSYANRRFYLGVSVNPNLSTNNTVFIFLHINNTPNIIFLF